MIKDGEVLICEANHRHYLDFTDPHTGEKKAKGLRPRDFESHPVGCYSFAPKADIKPLARSEWAQRIADNAAKQALLSDVRMQGKFGKMIESRDQNGKGYCWAHSTVSAALLMRAKQGEPFADLSAYAIACMIKGFRDEGGWNAESMEFLRDKGCPTSEYWAQRSMARANDNPKTWENALKFRDTAYADIPNRDFDTLMTYLILGFAAPIDLNWWSHSVCAMDPIDGAKTFNKLRDDNSGKLLDYKAFNKVWEVDKMGGAWGVRIWNSWGDTWSTNGAGILTESKATPDGSIVMYTMEAA